MIEREVILRREDAQIIRRGADILKRARPAATWLAGAAILDIPGREARRGQRGADEPKVGQIVARAPVAAMNTDHDWVRPMPGGNAQVAELLGSGAICDALVGVGRLRSRISSLTAPPWFNCEGMPHHTIRRRDRPAPPAACARARR